MKRAMRRAIRREVEHGLRRVREYPRLREIPPEHIKATYTTTPTPRGCDWEVDIQIGGWPNLGTYEMARRWHPGDLRYAGNAPDAAEAAEQAREVIDFARAVHAELVTTVAPPSSTEVIL